jgi:preprotein translocase subunit SecB
MISPLRLDHYLIDSVEIEANTAYDRRDELVGTMDVDPQHLLHKERPDVHQLVLTVAFGLSDEDPSGAPYTGRIVGRAYFHLEGEDLSEQDKVNLIVVNGAAILYGLLRGQVAQITAMSHFGSFLLPPVNLVEAFNRKAEALAAAGDDAPTSESAE